MAFRFNRFASRLIGVNRRRVAVPPGDLSRLDAVPLKPRVPFFRRMSRGPKRLRIRQALRPFPIRWPRRGYMVPF